MENIDTHASTFKEIWKLTDTLPKYKLFLWKAMRESIPVDGVTSHRTGKQPSGYPACGDLESTVHALLTCPRARQIWYQALGLRSDMLPSTMKEAIKTVLGKLDASQIPMFAAVMWELWKSRCKWVFEGKTIPVQKVLANAGYLVHTVQMARNMTTRKNCVQQAIIPACDYRCYTDGSWTHSYQGGAAWAYVLWYKEELVEYAAGPVVAPSPFSAELQAMMWLQKGCFKGV